MSRHRDLLGAVLLALVLETCGCARPGLRQPAESPLPRLPRIHPDYAGVTLPPNIAPITFRVDEPGRRYCVRVRAADQGFERCSASATVAIPVRQWRRLLQAARGRTISFEVSVQSDGDRWVRFRPVVARVAREPIDPVLVFRQIGPVFNVWSDIRVYQRDLTTYRQRLVLEGSAFEDGCLNCHSFSHNRATLMSIDIRSQQYGNGTLVVQDGRVIRMSNPWGYPSWHPSGRLVAYSLNKVDQFFHSAGAEVRDVVDWNSDIVVQEFPSNRVSTTRALADPGRLETYPAWSADGRHLYFCSARRPWGENPRLPPEGYSQLRYDLHRIRYDAGTRQWGELETLIRGDDVNGSVLIPRPSPDGRFLLFCVCRYGCFPIYQPSSDLYLMDLRSGRFRRLEINSEQSESWHSWSSNSRWIAFSSKRGGGLFTRTYISYVTPEGRVDKPFVVPQKDPDFYDSCLKNFTVPELVCEPVPAGPKALARKIRSGDQIAVRLPAISMTSKQKGGGAQSAPEPAWRNAPAR